MTDTKRLYYEDVYIKEFSAKVVECRKGEKGFQVLLDRSAFYPEGGDSPVIWEFWEIQKLQMFRKRTES